jgi:very-short-patch-repair endonuclease
MRHSPTFEEAALWRLLKGEQLAVRFQRQVVIGPFIADFAAPAVRLVVEVDGGCHARRVRQDARRDEKLRRWGWRVLRFSSEAVLHRPSEVVAVIQTAVARGLEV